MSVNPLTGAQKACDDRAMDRIEKQWDLANVFDEVSKKKKKGLPALSMLTNGTSADGNCRTGKKGRSFRLSEL